MCNSFLSWYSAFISRACSRWSSFNVDNNQLVFLVFHCFLFPFSHFRNGAQSFTGSHEKHHTNDASSLTHTRSHLKSSAPTIGFSCFHLIWSVWLTSCLLSDNQEVNTIGVGDPPQPFLCPFPSSCKSLYPPHTHTSTNMYK